MMNGLEFISSLIASLSWPLVIVAGFFVFRSGLNGLLDRLADFEGFGVRARLNREVNEVREVLEGKIDEASESVPGNNGHSEASELPEFLEWKKALERFQDSIVRADSVVGLRGRGDRSAVSLAWSALENLLNDVARVLRLHDAEEDQQIRLRASQLKLMGIIDSDMANVIARMSVIRNDAFHGLADSEVAQGFVGSVLNIGSFLESTVSQRISSAHPE